MITSKHLPTRRNEREGTYRKKQKKEEQPKVNTSYTQGKEVFDLREEWVRELRNSKKVSAMKVDTAQRIADMMAPCLSLTVCDRLMFELSAIARARDIARKHLGGTQVVCPIYFQHPNILI